MQNVHPFLFGLRNRKITGEGNRGNYFEKEKRKRTGKPVEMTIRTMWTGAGLHTSNRLLLEAVREIKVQDFTTEL